MLSVVVCVSLLAFCCTLRCYIKLRRKFNDLNKGLKKEDKKKSGSGEDLNKDVVSGARSSRGRQRASSEETSFNNTSISSSGSDSVIFERGRRVKNIGPRSNLVFS